LGLRQDPIVLGRRHIYTQLNGSGVTQFYWSLLRILNILIFPIIKSITIKNSIIYVINILIFIIIKRTNIKNSFIYITNSICVKNILLLLLKFKILV
jgi:hypothetical protein